MKLIIPAAGRSSRFPNVKPKWMLTHPNGNLMVIEAIKGLNLADFTKIYLVVLKEHIELYKCFAGIHQAFEELGVADKFEMIQLEEQTQSQPETVALAIEKCDMDGSIYIKDTDNFFVTDVSPINQISTSSLELFQQVNAGNKSYVMVNHSGIVTNIAEKNIISSSFCVGGYSFRDAKEYLNYYKSLKNDHSLYISHIIFKMILDGVHFKAVQVSDYADWGTLADWNHYKRNFATLFIDIDGVLVYNSSRYFEPQWGESSAIKENAAVINKLYASGKVQVILTTSRSSDYKNETIEQLKREGILYHQIIFDLFHAKRMIINDYAASNPYKCCEAINLKRNSTNLQDLLEETMGAL